MPEVVDGLEDMHNFLREEALNRAAENLRTTRSTPVRITVEVYTTPVIAAQFGYDELAQTEARSLAWKAFASFLLSYEVGFRNVMEQEGGAD